ncbi:peptidase M20 [Novosphingobium marinum]|uniref:Acetylornithine deacetylase/succinyl-diaminopimelate desuccinylase-like protein n=1 Tax=Novosphingobium marinum TaxID=1514948 RepID=A0A7Z0BW47_9SPHN|nr:M20/M25/M40 family metallo-hydrolase [Novosphingobium marinum]NYH96963.1 acetylornithine deacetylase/succinyl-diaminopimelate desuccinylase-like protein [Novosphingobium marinum]GGC42011.1 peptidase M20 [Novosphingobium marinum]
MPRSRFRTFISLAAALPLAVAAPAFAQDRTEHEQMARDLYRDVIAFRTAKGHTQVPELVSYLSQRLEAAGFAPGNIMATDYDSDGERTQGLIVRYPGKSRSKARPIVVLAHMDVVDARPEDWERNPFELTEDGGYLYGRGVTDNKYGVTNLVSTFIRLRQEGWTPSRDIYLAFSGDEESGMVSTRAQAKWVAENVEPGIVLNSDAGGIALASDFTPLAMRVQAAEKTFATFILTVTNPGGHSSRPRKDNAIYELADALLKVRDYTFPVQATPLTRSYFRELGKTVPGELGAAMRQFAEDPTDEEAIATLRADPAYVGTLGTTCIATMLDAGHAENALPQSAKATVNCRIFPGVGVEATEEALKQAIANDAVQFTLDTDVTESPISELRPDVRSALAKSLKKRFGNVAIIPYMESGGTDGMHYRTLGMPVVAISGVAARPEDQYAHGLNERILTESFYGGLDHWYVILKDLAG